MVNSGKKRKTIEGFLQGGPPPRLAQVRKEIMRLRAIEEAVRSLQNFHAFFSPSVCAPPDMAKRMSRMKRLLK